MVVKTCTLKEVLAKEKRLKAEAEKVNQIPLWRILSPGQMFAILIIEAVSLYILGFIINKATQ